MSTAGESNKSQLGIIRESLRQPLTGELAQVEGDTLRRLQDWLEDSVIDSTHKAEVAELVRAEKGAELRERFYRELEFGTGGLRGVLGAGTNRMNRYVVRRATQGLANFLLKNTHGSRASVVIAHDCRRGSKEFSHDAAAVLAANGIQAWVFPDVQTTPMLSFAVRNLQASGGICITASHNPPTYNGMKMYGRDGAQHSEPEDKMLLEEVFAVTNWSQAKSMDVATARSQGLIQDVPERVFQSYLETVKSLQQRSEKITPVRIAYTPLHGTGTLSAVAALKSWGFSDVHVVEEQAKPDGNFPTVSKPNPEDPAALRLLIALAEKLGADLACATDPDSDRLGVVVRDPQAAAGAFRAQAMGDMVFLNGNQTGALLLDYLLSSLAGRNKLKPTDHVIKTIVTSELHRAICEKYHVGCSDTLTGFKWIAALIRRFETDPKQSKTFLFGTEESFGFMPNNNVRDKDGIAALCQAAEMTSFQKDRGKTLCDRLLELFVEFGAWQEDLLNIDLEGEQGARAIAKFMAAMRGAPPTAWAGTAVTEQLDYQKQIRTAPGTAVQPFADLPVSDVLQFFLADGSKISMRPSGTEPKLKIYISVCTHGPDAAVSLQKSIAKVQQLRAELTAKVKELV